MFIRALLLGLFLALGTTELMAQSVSPAAKRSDSVEVKLALLQEAIKNRDYDLARSLTHSLRDGVVQLQYETEPLPESLVPSSQWQTVDLLPQAWRSWATPWKYFKQLELRETAGLARVQEPVEISLAFPSDQTDSLARELRVARIENDQLFEVPSQILRERFRASDKVRHAQLLMQISCAAHDTVKLLIFYGNPNAELPEYPSDLTTVGEGWGLELSNAYFKAILSRQTGQLERLILRREHGLELYAGGEGHGEPPGIDWAHDYVDADNFQKLRISLWDRCPDYEVIRGPLCTVIRRWGFPYSPVHPIDTPAKLKIEVEYRFYSGLPWFHKFGSMRAIQSFDASALRDDEWVFSGQPFTDKLWIDAQGRLQSGDVPPAHQEQLWGIGFTNRDSKDAFMAIFLEHAAHGLPELKHNGSPNLYYRWHGSVWSRYPLPVRSVPAGAELVQRNAYLTLPLVDNQSHRQVEELRRCLLKPLHAAAAQHNLTTPSPKASSETLARESERDQTLISKNEIWQALADCKDAQLYTADINIVELGLVYDVRVRGDVVTIIMTTPHAGRNRLGYFIDGSISVHPTISVPVRERLMQIKGVRQVVFQYAKDPAWNSNRLTEAGRRKLGLR